ncbi:hypothetical protein CF8_0076 [Aeromonas phage CF8]|nr:hypothetical protein CF8_0076 [Aeromonas phage CF8]
MRVYPSIPFVHPPAQLSTFVFYIEEEVEEDLLHVLASGLCTLIVHSNDAGDDDIVNPFSMDLANYQMGDMLADCYGSIANFDKEYSFCTVKLKQLVQEQGSLLNTFVTTSDNIAQCFYLVKPKMIHISIQEGLPNGENPTMMAIQAGIESFNAYTNTVGGQLEYQHV